MCGRFLLIWLYIVIWTYYKSSQMFSMGSIKPSPVKMMYFYPRVCCKAYDTFSFFPVCILAKIVWTVSWSIVVIKANKFLVVVFQWRENQASIVCPLRSTDGWRPMVGISLMWRLVYIWHLILMLLMDELLDLQFLSQVRFFHFNFLLILIWSISSSNYGGSL